MVVMLMVVLNEGRCTLPEESVAGVKGRGCGRRGRGKEGVGAGGGEVAVQTVERGLAGNRARK